MLETKIYVGLNDADTNEQRFDTARYVSVLQHICKSYGTSFSFTVAQCGYVYEDGRYALENTLVVTLVDVARDVAEQVARDLCAFFRQESVLMTEGTVSAVYINERV